VNVEQEMGGRRIDVLVAGGANAYFTPARHDALAAAAWLKRVCEGQL
jgi:hypothetical protein